MQYILTREELDKYVSKDEYDELQQVVDQKCAALDAIWSAIDKLPEDVKTEFIKNADIQAEFQSREIGKVMNPIVDAGIRAYAEKSAYTLALMRGEARVAARGVFVVEQVPVEVE